MQSHFLAAINQLCAEKNLPREAVMETVEAALKAAYRKDYGDKEHEEEIEVDLADSIDKFTIYQVKTVVDKITEYHLEITVKEAAKYKKDPKVGDKVKIDVTPPGFGRIAAQSAKQVIIQRLQEAERDIMYENFKDRENELINAQVHRVQDSKVYIDLGKITVVLPREYQIPGERYYAGQRVKLYLDKVLKTPKGPQLLISRTHSELVRKLFELEIPEVQTGVVKLERIAREPGVRTKITVSSTDEKIDPVGACVGQKGVRIQAVMEELNGERIDVMPHETNVEKLLRAALAPAEIVYVELDETAGQAKVYVEEEQRPLAIGRKGQNVRLASKLTGLIVDIEDASALTEEQLLKARSSKAQEMTKEKQKAKKEEAAQLEIFGLEIPDQYMQALSDANLTLVEQLKGLSVADLATIEGLDKEGAEIVHEAIKKA